MAVVKVSKSTPATLGFTGSLSPLPGFALWRSVSLCQASSCLPPPYGLPSSVGARPAAAGPLPPETGLGTLWQPLAPVPSPPTCAHLPGCSPSRPVAHLSVLSWGSPGGV